MSNASVTGGRSRRQSQRQRVVDTLVRHGLSERAAAALYRLGLALRRRMLHAPNRSLWTEHAGTVDAQTGRRYGPIAGGAHRSVDVAPQLHAASGHSAACAHTHLGSSSFSTDDVQLLLEEVVLDLVAAIGADGTWYLISVAPGAAAPAVPQMETQYDATTRALAPTYRALVRLGALTREAAWRELTHLTWERIAPGLGLRYHRVEGTP